MGTSRKKCPLCSKKLVEINGIPTCPDCGYKEPVSSVGTGTAASVQPVKKEKSSEKIIFALSAAVAAICAIGVVVWFIMGGLPGAAEVTENKTGSESVSSGAANTDILSEIRGNRESRESSAEEESGNSISDRVQIYSLPKSEFLIDLVEVLFDKPVNEVTYEELCSIIYLDIYELNDTDVMAVDVYFSDGTGASWLMPDYYVDTTDLNCLEGLQYLYLDAVSVNYGTDWHKLKNLQALSCDASMSDIAKYMDVSQLIYLSVEDTFGMNDLSALSEFTSLQYFELDAGLLDSIEGISQATSLRGLYITDGDRISDFSELYDMPWLEELAIESKGLKDIGFISEMDNLYYLSLKETEIRKIDALLDCADTLRVLLLDDNYQVEDISPVFECTGLEQLQLWVDYQFDIPMEAPDFSAMTNLWSLSLDGYDRFSNLALLPGLTELTIEGPGSGDGEFLKELTSLKTLNLVDMSVYEGFIEGITCVESLETLNLEDCFIWCDISPVFELPSLQELNLEWAECGICPEELAVSESLVRLNLTHTTFDSLREDGSWDYGNYDTELSMQEVLDTLALYMPNLRELYVPDHELDDLDFASNFSQLLLLDVTNNYITDLSPLTNLEHLTVLLCENNPIRNTDGLEEVIVVQ